MQTIDFPPDHLAQVRAGTKTTTVRYREDIAPGRVTLVFVGKETTSKVAATVTRILPGRLSDLTDADAEAAGFADRAELVEQLTTVHYPGMPEDAEIAVVHFEV
ncbi:ASCH domain-containing protein [Georgenia sp. SYP-B2076]|uniref:ASCH domain-containing protein n=1 Tax=Georgenia sp. SYP-B2076 TaxID=2495881 RepID=UPI0013DE879E|nr:ASCH domain-containing protein [Georgenia sp. SYP-B2076]